MQVQINPTVTSTVDHSEAGRLSQVGLCEFAKETRDCSRMMLTTVTLEMAVSVEVRSKMGKGRRLLQSSDCEHHGYAELLLPMHFEIGKLGEGERKHPEVKQDADGRIRPPESIDIQTTAVVFSVPARPIVADGPAREDSQESEDEPDDEVEDDRAPHEPLDSRTRKDG